MKSTTGSADHNIQSVLDSIRKDKRSWQGWLCLRIGMPAGAEQPRQRQALIDIGKGLEKYLQDKQARVFCDNEGNLFIFCKNVSESVLNEIGGNALDYMAQEVQVEGQFRVFDVFADADAMVGVTPVSEQDGKEQRAAHISKTHSVESGADVLPGSHHPKVLLVDDDPVIRWIVRTALKGFCDLATAQEASHALHLYQRFKPDIVFLDINLPWTSGREVLKSLLEIDPGANVVMFSSFDGMDNIIAMQEMGAKGFIPKPFDMEKLLHYINKCGSL